jgi:hypothetical protein
MVADVLSMFNRVDIESLSRLHSQMISEVRLRNVDIFCLYQSGTLSRDFSFDWCVPEALSRDYLVLRLVVFYLL